MRNVPLGSSGMNVPVVGIGTMGLGGYFQRDDTNDSEAIIRIQEGIELGATLIDTAEIYGAGHTEELVGRAIKPHREKVVIATKFSPENSSASAVINAVERSLKRLAVDCIDLYQTHWPNPSVPFAETLEALDNLLRQGKIRAVGLSNSSRRQWLLAKNGLPPGSFVSFQQQYNLADRFVETTHLPVCRDEGLALIAYSPLMEGKIAPNDARRCQLDDFARQYEITTVQLVIAWLLRHPEVVVIPKAASARHVQENVAAASLVLNSEVLAKIDQMYRSVIIHVFPRDIKQGDAVGRNVYRTLQEALQNPSNMTPSPREVADELISGEPFKPIKLSRYGNGTKAYSLVEGRLRYWAWVIANGNSRPLPCIIV